MNKWTKWIALLLIIVVSWIEAQYVNESPPEALSSNTRKMLHFVFYIIVGFLGYMGWLNSPIKWLKKLWLYSYVAILVFVMAFVLIASKTTFFSMPVKDTVHLIMIYFISPVPFIILWVLSTMKGISNHSKQ